MYKKLLSIYLFYYLATSSLCAGQQVLNICMWYQYIPENIIAQFEKEYNIKVIINVHDDDNVLEARLIAGNTGYDLIITNAWPFIARQIKNGFYEKLNISLLSNYQNIDPKMLKRLAHANYKGQYAVPYFWGMVAIAYNHHQISQLLPGNKFDSWELIYNQKTLAKIHKMGIGLLDNFIEFFATYYIYKNLNILNHDLATLDKLTQELLPLRKYWRRFNTDINLLMLLNKEINIIMHWNESLLKLKSDAASFTKDKQTDIKIVLPKEGTLMWIDCISIVKGAKNIDNAYLLINFLLRPEIAAQITNITCIPTSITKSRKLLSKHLKNNPILFPGEKYMKKVICPEIYSRKFIRLLSRKFDQIISHK